MNPTSVTFNGNSLQTNTSSFPQIITSSIDHESIPTKNDTLYPIAHGNQSFIPFVDYPTKPIKLTGYVLGSSKQLMEAELDTFRGYFNTTSGNLDIAYNGSTRRYIATADKVPVVRPQGLTMATFEVDFQTNYPWGFDTFTTNLYTVSGILQSFTQALTYSGSAPFQAPIATFTMQSMSSTTNQSISYGNLFTGQQATVTRNWSFGDVVIFDATQNQVFVNGVVTQYAGAIPQFIPGSGTFTYSDTFSVRSYLLSMAYVVRYD